jgi:hypothetical protein
MKTQQITISEVRLVYRTKVKDSEKLQVKSSKEAFRRKMIRATGFSTHPLYRAYTSFIQDYQGFTRV